VTSLRLALDEYLSLRRAAGFKLERPTKLLPGFVRYLERAGRPFITNNVAVRWATLPRDVHPAWWAQRLIMVRGFAKHLHVSDPRHEIPPLELLAAKRPRAAPYIYESQEIAALLAATAAMTSPLRAVTYETLLGLLAVTGMRVGEAIALDESDVDRRHGVVLIRKGKFGKTREVPVHATTTEHLDRYARVRDRLLPRRNTPSFFVSTAKTRLIYQNVHDVFLGLIHVAGLGSRRPRRPNIHDLRHTFAVRTVLAWHRAGEDVEARLPTLSTYLGHVGPSATYWYLTAVPELLESAATRLERAWRGRP
jgi:integrase/recombinase XerD